MPYFYCHSLFDRQYHWAWSWLIVALVTICCWPSRPTFPFSLRIRSAWRKCWAFRPTKYCDQSYNEPRSCSVILSILMQNDNKKIQQISELQQLLHLLFLKLPFINITYHYYRKLLWRNLMERKVWWGSCGNFRDGAFWNPAGGKTLLILNEISYLFKVLTLCVYFIVLAGLFI